MYVGVLSDTGKESVPVKDTPLSDKVMSRLNFINLRSSQTLSDFY